MWQSFKSYLAIILVITITMCIKATYTNSKALKKHRHESLVKATFLVKSYEIEDVHDGYYLDLTYFFSLKENFLNEKLTTTKIDQEVYAILGLQIDKHVYSKWGTGPYPEGVRPTYFVPKFLVFNKPNNLSKDEIFIKGQISESGRIVYGIEKYLVKAGIAKPEPEDGRIVTEVKIDGNGKIVSYEIFLEAGDVRRYLN